jgi:flagellar biosynthesis protein FlhA
MRNGAAAPLVVMAMLAMVVVPLAPLVLDAMFTLNIALSLVVLLAVVYVKRPLEFSVFPERAADGHPAAPGPQRGIHARGPAARTRRRGRRRQRHRIVRPLRDRGNYASASWCSRSSTIVNFVVVTKGSGRISEVSRALHPRCPARQADGDRRRPQCGPAHTRGREAPRREEVREEADFYGSMDGASKFVRGDAIAGLLILAINIVGGLLIGVLQHDMGFGDAAQHLIAARDRRRPGGAAAGAADLHRGGDAGHARHRVSRRWARRSTIQVFGQERALTVAAVLLGIIRLGAGHAEPAVPRPRRPCSATPRGRLHQRNAVVAQAVETMRRRQAPSAAGRTGLGRVAPGRTAGPGSRLSTDRARRQEPERRPAGAAERRAPEAHARTSAS